MEGFPTMEPAFTVRLNPEPGYRVGNTAAGDNLTIVPFHSGSLVTVSGFPIPVEADVVFGSDYVRMEASQTHLRINVSAAMKTKDGHTFSYNYKGIVEVTPSFLAILMNSPDAKTTEYGNCFTHITIETGSERLKPLEHSLFVGSAHFVVKPEGG